MGALAILMLLHLAMHHGGLFTRVDDKPWLGAARPAARSRWRGGSMASAGTSAWATPWARSPRSAMAGCLLGTILRRDSDVATHRDRLSWAATFAIGLFLAGLVTDTFEGINKIAATPTWCLWSAALACLAWMILYLVMDVGGLPRPGRSSSDPPGPTRWSPTSCTRSSSRPCLAGRAGRCRPEVQGLARSVGGRRRLARDGVLRLRRDGPARAPGSAHEALTSEIRLATNQRVRPRGSASDLSWPRSRSNRSKSSDWAPSDRAWSGSGWTSISRPSAPAASAASAIGGT